jgi:hypothetical protein
VIRRAASVWLIVAGVVVVVAGALAAGWAWLDSGSGGADRAAEYCRLDKRASAVRWAIYGPPFSEGPAEIEALVAESEALAVELDRLAPDEIRHVHEMLDEEFAGPIDALTEERGWDPLAAVNTGEAIVIFEDRDINAAMDELWSFKLDYCFVEEDLTSPTDPLTFDGQTVTVYNGSPALNDALEWSLQRFAVAGLEVPEVASATFTVQSGFCDGIRAHYLRTESGVELEFCMDEDSACEDDECTKILPAWRAVVLHEIAHAWLDTHLGAIDVERFLDHVGLDTWRDPDLAWDQNGLEHAADTIAWGLMDRDIEMLRIGQPTADELAEGFHILTGIDPLPRDG